MSHVMYHLYLIFIKFLFYFYRVLDLVGGGSVINGAYRWPKILYISGLFALSDSSYPYSHRPASNLVTIVSLMDTVLIQSMKRLVPQSISHSVTQLLSHLVTQSPNHSDICLYCCRRAAQYYNVIVYVL